MRKNQVRVRGILTLTLALTLFFVPTAPALAVITLWTGAAQDGGNWDTAGNWTNGVPTSSDSVRINNGGTANISGTANASGIDIGANDNNVSGTLNIDGSSAKLDMLDGLAYIGYDVPDGNNYGEVNLKSDGKFNAGYISLGEGGEGIITINGTDSKLTVSDMLFPDPAYAGIALIGSNGGSGTLNLTGGGTADIT